MFYVDYGDQENVFSGVRPITMLLRQLKLTYSSHSECEFIAKTLAAETEGSLSK